jgi:septum formation protein
MNKPNLVLASTSAYRQQLLKQLGMDFICAAPQVDEQPRSGEPPAQTALRLAREKAAAIFATHRNAVVIGSDQVADLYGKALGKPYSAEVAFDQLSACSGQSLTFHTGIAVTSPQGTHSQVVTTQVRFRKLSEQQLRNYIKKEAALDCAGSFKCEGLGISLFESIESDDPTALIGLPLISLTSLLLQHGLDPLGE